MEFLIGLLVVVLLAMFFGVLWVVARGGKMDREAAERAPEILDDVFTGEDQVAYWRGIGGLTTDALLTAASERGYALTHTAERNSGTTFVFTKKADV